MTSPPELLQRLLAEARAAVERRLLGLSAEEIRYTVDDIRAEIRATRAELLEQIAAVRADLDRLVASAADADDTRTD